MLRKKNWQDKLIEQLSFKYGLDKRVVKEVVYYPLLFTKNVMTDPSDNTPIRIRHFGAFAYRGSRSKEKVEHPKYMIVIQHAEELYNIYYKEYFETLDQFVEYIVDCFKEKDYSAIRKVHEIFKEKIKYANKLKQNEVE